MGDNDDRDERKPASEGAPSEPEVEAPRVTGDDKDSAEDDFPIDLSSTLVCGNY